MKNKIVLITGASRGIGQAILLTLAKQGAIVIGTATSQTGADKISKQLSEENLLGTGMVLNVTNDEQISQVLSDINEQYGSIDVLVNNAGITRDNLLVRMKTDEWHDIMSTNLNSVYKLSKGVLRGMMKKRTGRIISITSVVGAMGNAGQTNYAASKAGVMGFSKSLAREVGNRGITVNTIAPGFIQTNMTDAMSDEAKETMSAQIPMGRLGQPQEIADCVVFLASNQAGYITGQTIHVNGGLYTV